jgi:CubicO group peptidase (beta-lactamase class C family)
LAGVGAMTAVGCAVDPRAADRRSSPAVSGRSKTATLASRLAASIQKHNVPGASAAIFRGGEWEVAATGVTNVTTGVDITPQTVIPVGSILKVVNATLVMQLVDEGLVDLALPLKRYLPDFDVADRDATERITVGMLLNHTSGIDGEYFPDAGPDSGRIEDVIPRIAQQGQIHAPGAELSYCNAGAVLAGYLAQRLLQKSWYTLIEERIFKPLEMQHSVVQPANALLHRTGLFARASGGATNWAGYFAEGNVYVTNDLRIGSGAIGGAAGYKLAVDGKIIAEELRIKLSQNWPDYVFEENYALLPLNELENSIKTNKHLPGIPSAQHVEENGILIGEIQTQLLQKIEELTLYIIALDKENKELQLRVHQIEKSNSTNH